MMKRGILILDDERDSAEELAARLAALGYEVAGIAASAEEAVALAGQSAPRLLLARDGGDAPRAAAALQGPWPIPVVTLAEAGSDEPGERLVAPFGDRELRATVELALCRHQAARTQHELDGFFSVSADLFCFLDFSGYFKRLNPAWERTLGFTLQELMSRPFIEFVHPDDRERTLAQNRAVRGGGRAQGFENRYLCRDGSYRWLLWNSAPASGDPVIYAVARDITARRQAEEERAELVRQLQASLAEVRTLREILPICSYCRKIRDDQDYWESVEGYIARHTNTRFSHGICPHCMETRVAPELADYERQRNEADGGG